MTDNLSVHLYSDVTPDDLKARLDYGLISQLNYSLSSYSSFGIPWASIKTVSVASLVLGVVVIPELFKIQFLSSKRILFGWEWYPGSLIVFKDE